MAADANVRTYDPKKVVVTWGAIIFSGFADGTFVQVARNGDVFEKRRGSDGSVDRINKNADDYSVTLTLMQTSITNDLLSSAMIADQLSNLGVFPLVVKDLRGTTLFFAAQAWIAKDPDDEHTDSLGNREWKIDTGIATKFTGGNLLI